MTETAIPPVVDPVADRIDKLEKTVTHLRKKVRRLERTVPPIEITPELAAEIDRRLKDIEVNPHDEVSWDEVQAAALKRFQS